jgi:hypothetical protein
MRFSRVTQRLNVPKRTPSLFHSLRPYGIALLSILRGLFLLSSLWVPFIFHRATIVFPQPPRHVPGPHDSYTLLLQSDPLLRSSSLVVHEARGEMSVSVSSHERYNSRGTRPRAMSPRTVINHAGLEPVWHCHSSRGEREAGRCAAAGPKKPEAYSLEHGVDFSGPRRT